MEFIISQILRVIDVLSSNPKSDSIRCIRSACKKVMDEEPKGRPKAYELVIYMASVKSYGANLARNFGHFHFDT